MPNRESFESPISPLPIHFHYLFLSIIRLASCIPFRVEVGSSTVFSGLPLTASSAPFAIRDRRSPADQGKKKTSKGIGKLNMDPQNPVCG